MNLLYLEIAANVTTAICIFLAARNNTHTWWTGIVACLLFALLFFNVQLYADVTLQAFFVVTGIIGWYNWNTNSKRIENVSAWHFALAVATALLASVGYGTMLHMYTDAFAPMVDSLVLTFSIVAQVLLMKRYVETWPVWIVVNVLSVPLYISRELYITAGMYSLFLINAIYAFKSWKRSM